MNGLLIAGFMLYNEALEFAGMKAELQLIDLQSGPAAVHELSAQEVMDNNLVTRSLIQLSAKWFVFPSSLTDLRLMRRVGVVRWAAAATQESASALERG